MIVLDTQHVSQLQRSKADAERLTERLDALGEENVALTIITPYEQLRACLGRINSRRGGEPITHFALLAKLLDYYAQWKGRIFPFDDDADRVYRGFPPELIRRIGPMDCRIAAIVLARGATLLSANRKDFSQVPGLSVEDWLSG